MNLLGLWEQRVPDTENGKFKGPEMGLMVGKRALCPGCSEKWGE